MLVFIAIDMHSRIKIIVSKKRSLGISRFKLKLET